MITSVFHPYHTIQLGISSNNKVLHFQRSHAIHGDNISYLQAILVLLYQFPLLLVNFLFGNTCDYNNTWTVGVHSSSWFAISLLTINFIYLPYLFLNTLHTHKMKWNHVRKNTNMWISKNSKDLTETEGLDSPPTYKCYSQFQVQITVEYFNFLLLNLRIGISMSYILISAQQSHSFDIWDI